MSEILAKYPPTMNTKQSVPDDYEDAFIYVPKNPGPMHTYWETTGKKRLKSINLREIDDFNARWMRSIYGRSDCTPVRSGPGRHTITFCFGMWLARDGKVLARFSSRSKDIWTRSLEVVGLRLPDYFTPGFDNEELVPQILRDAYSDWQLRNLEDSDFW